MLQKPDSDKLVVIRREKVDTPWWPIRWRIWFDGMYWGYEPTFERAVDYANTYFKEVK